MRRVVISPLAEDDLGKITDHYFVEAGLEVTSAFQLAWDRCTSHIGQFLDSGSQRLAEKSFLGHFAFGL